MDVTRARSVSSAVRAFRNGVKKSGCEADRTLGYAEHTKCVSPPYALLLFFPQQRGIYGKKSIFSVIEWFSEFNFGAILGQFSFKFFKKIKNRPKVRTMTDP